MFQYPFTWKSFKERFRKAIGHIRTPKGIASLIITLVGSIIGAILTAIL